MDVLDYKSSVQTKAMKECIEWEPKIINNSCFPCLHRGLHSSLLHLSPFQLHSLVSSAAHVPTILIYSVSVSDTESIPIISLSDTPHIHLTILISVHSNLPLWSTVMAYVSLPYTIPLLTHVTYSFPFLPCQDP